MEPKKKILVVDGKRPRITGMGALSLMAAAIGGVMPATATQATPTEQVRSVSQTQQKSERAALPVQTQARAAYGMAMLGGRGGMPVYGGFSAPWLAPRYNQRKARRDARRVNRAVKH